ncbi:hypothetical protein JM83_1734 [Gillisia sp. Hel_I_86]|uniref:hypothetical protein n=1 Tax=Gillisia sp. Hel_I_86 TaxID=1249981 RepID=UPI00119A3997|nr:hypothetical protein [Gillisia sp. Hel_I_86]TVZ26747.1 hypothetical protein JM83_1734 [Gillisia sp. Hel_I_86]
MGKYYIYNAKIEDDNFKNVTVIFNPDTNFNFSTLKNELTNYFKFHHQTAALVFVHCKKEENIKGLVLENIDTIFKSIPKVEETSLRKNIFFVPYDGKSFNFKKKRFLEKNKKEILNQGLAEIFIGNGGLIESNGISHHFVFPSGKHSTKFLRTANVLVHKSEIDFIAINTLHLFQNIEFENIYCDTLSINVVAYSITKFVKRFHADKEINIESFKSYDGLYNKQSIFYDNAIFLISASTSGGLINYLQSTHPEIRSEEICTLFYLPIDKNSKVALERVLCNLERNKKLNYGIDLYHQSRRNEECVYCKNHSTPISIQGDSFSLDEPIINTRNISASKYITKSIKDFVEIFKYNGETERTSLKVSYSEESAARKKYNLYIDYENVIDDIGKSHFESHKKKLDAYIMQYVPASLKYIVHLNDKGSFKLSEYIRNRIKPDTRDEILIFNQSELTESLIEENEVGSILIVGSCISNGKNLLYLSRFFRNYESLRLIYFIGINRISDSSKYSELKTNVKYGLYGKENSSFVEIEAIQCDNSSSDTPWEKEIEHLQWIQQDSGVPPKFIEERLKIISEFANIQTRGGSESIFYTDINKQPLKIRKNSAFFNDNNYHENVTQSDVYFTISCVLNNMRNNKEDGLYQTSFVKNILDPFIFNRFNDGIIQASILRAAREEELNYSYSQQHSNDMLTLIKTFIKHINEYQGEAIIEFLYALSIRKLKLVKSHYAEIINELEGHEDERINIFKKSIKRVYDELYPKSYYN